MAKQTGLGQTTLSVDDALGTARDIRASVTDWDMGTPRAVIDTTGVDKFAFERLLGLVDFTINLNGVPDFAENNSHDVFSTVTSGSTPREVTVVLNAQTMVNNCLFTDYQLKRGNDGALTYTAPGMLADGVVPTWS